MPPVATEKSRAALSVATDRYTAADTLDVADPSAVTAPRRPTNPGAAPVRLPPLTATPASVSANPFRFKVPPFRVTVLSSRIWLDAEYRTVAPLPTTRLPPIALPYPLPPDPPGLPSTSVPSDTTVSPVKVLALLPASTRVPGPALVSPPVPASVWDRVKVLTAASMSNPPPPAPQVTARGVEVKAVPVTWGVPPANVSPPLAAPRLPSPPTLRVPAARVVPPT